MSEDGGGSGVLRVVFGRPRLWLGIFWTAAGLAWFTLVAVEGPRWDRLILGTVWTALGIAYGSLAVRDRIHHTGRYARR